MEKTGIKALLLTAIILLCSVSFSLGLTVNQTGWSDQSVWSGPYEAPPVVGPVFYSDIEWVVGSPIPVYTGINTWSFSSIPIPVSETVDVLVQEMTVTFTTTPGAGSLDGEIEGIPIPAGSTLTINNTIYAIQSGSYANHAWFVGEAIFDLGSMGTFVSDFLTSSSGSTDPMDLGCIFGQLSGVVMTDTSVTPAVNMIEISSKNGAQSYGSITCSFETIPTIVSSTPVSNVQLLAYDAISASGSVTGLYTGPLDQTGKSIYLEGLNTGAFYGTSFYTGGSSPAFSIFSFEEDAQLVPDLYGLPQAEAEAEIMNNGFSIGAVTDAYSCVMESGRVMNQSLLGGESAAPGSAIDIEVSLGPASGMSMGKGITDGSLPVVFYTDYPTPSVGPVHSARMEHALAELNPSYITNDDWQWTTVGSSTSETVDIHETDYTTTFTYSGTIYTNSTPEGLFISGNGTQTINVKTIISGTYTYYWLLSGSYELDSGLTGTCTGVGFTTNPDPLDPANKTWIAFDGDIHGADTHIGRGVGSQGTLSVTSIKGEQAYGTLYFETGSRTEEASVLHSGLTIWIGNNEYSGLCTGAYNGPLTHTEVNILIPAFQSGMSFGSYTTSLGTGNIYIYHEACQETYSPPEIDDIIFDNCISELDVSPVNVTAHDPEGGSLTYYWNAPDGGSIIGSGPNVNFDPPDDGLHACPYRVQIGVQSDLTGLIAIETIYITVTVAGDNDQDGDADGTDLFDFVDSYSGSSLSDFAADFGKTDGCSCQSISI